MKTPSLVATALLLALAASGCGGVAQTTPKPPKGDPQPGHSPVAEHRGSATSRVHAETPAACVGDSTHHVTRLAPVVIPAVRAEASARRVVIPASAVDTGCIIEETAPAGCLGKVTVTGLEIPSVRVPAVGEVPGPRTGRVTTPTVCRLRTTHGGDVVIRPALLRPAVTRPALLGPALTVPPVRVDPVVVPPAALPYVPLRGRPDIDVVRDQRRTAFVAPARVLFAEDRSFLRRDARAALRSIVRTLNEVSPGGRITVDGYTDNQGSAESGLVLSKARARAVARWLTARGGVDRGRIEAVNGLGEAYPVAPNDTEAHMARNRRVVISVTR